MPNWTTPQDILDRWVGEDYPTDTDLIAALIQDAEAVIVSHYPRIGERIESDELPEDIVTMVTSRMVTRVLRNPEGLSSWQQTTGPFSQNRSFPQERDIWITQDEKDLLSPKVSGKAFSVDLAPNLQIPPRGLLDLDDIDPKWVIR